MRYTDLSRTVSRALRHEPWLYELELDSAGWVPVNALLAALRAEKPGWAALSGVDLAQMMAQADKKRYELRGGKIRALYGHSTPRKLSREAAEPPEILFHGTAPESAARIRIEGLRPMGRQYVHLSVDTVTAEQVGRRKTKEPVILRIGAGEAHRAGVLFYRGNNVVWLADVIAPEFIK